jgi:prepilin-type N-terminal cleavage/methylation domain-containing protein
MEKMKPIVNKKGFTLIELLVVIGILGVLAAALVATIDPFEQLKKAQDANAKNTTVELINANIRFYTTHNQMPWTFDTNCASIATSGNFAGVSLANIGGTLLAGPSACLTALITDGELKQAFTSATDVLRNIVISGTTNTITACFAPQSRAQRSDSEAKFNASGVTQVGCPNATATNCYWCSQ